MRFNPDNISLERNLPPLQNDNFLDILIKRIGNRVENYRPNPTDFINDDDPDYSEEQIKKDIAYIQKREEQWEQEAQLLTKEERDNYERAKKIANITESIVIDRLSGNWLNSDNNKQYRVVAHPTSTFDDISAGADVALEIKNNISQEDQHLGLSIDITYSNKNEVIDKKLDRIFDEINNNKQPKIKYFENEAEDYMGSIDIARCVVILSSSTVEDLFKKQFNRNREQLDNHPVQLSVLSQIEEQSETFYALALEKGNTKMARIYEETLNNIALLRENKKEDYHQIASSGEISYEDKYTGMKLLHKSLLRHLVRKNSKD